MHCLGEVGLLSKPRALKDLALELERRFIKGTTQPGMLHELAEGGAERIWRTVAGVVDKVDGARAGHAINSGTKYEEGRANNYADKIVLQTVPELVEVIAAGAARLDDYDDHERDEEGEQVGDEVVITKLHMLQINTLEKIWLPPASHLMAFCDPSTACIP